MDAIDEEVLFVGTAEAEHTEMYLKAVWHIREKGDDVKISTIAKRLNVTYNKAGVTLKDSGEKVASSMIRNSRLLEVLMDSALKIDIDEEMVCGIEHHMNKQFTDALCIMLKCPSKSPRGRDIPMGECCKTTRGAE